MVLIIFLVVQNLLKLFLSFFKGLVLHDSLKGVFICQVLFLEFENGVNQDIFLVFLLVLDRVIHDGFKFL
jgi:hypothetical protein